MNLKLTFQFATATAAIMMCTPAFAGFSECKNTLAHAIQTCQDSFDSTQSSISTERSAQAQSYGAGKYRMTGAGNDLTKATNEDAGKWAKVNTTCSDAKGTQDDHTGCFTDKCNGLPAELQETATQLQQSCIDNINGNLASAQSAQSDNIAAANQGNDVASSACDESNPGGCVQQVDMKCGAGFTLVGTIATKTVECRPLYGPYSGTPLR